MSTEATPLLLSQANNNVKPPSVITKRKPALWHVITPMFMMAFSFGAMFAPMIQLYTIVFCYRYYESQNSTGEPIDIPMENCAIPEIQAIVSEVQAVVMLLAYGSSLFVAGKYGALSDRKGRKWVMKFSGMGYMLHIFTYIITLKFPNVFGISLLFVAPLIRGLLAGDSIVIAVAQAYITDITTPKQRTMAFGNLLATVFLGTTLGPSAASIILARTGSILYIFYMVFIVGILFQAFIWFVMPESHDFQTWKETNSNQETNQNQTFLQRINVFSALNVLYRTSSKYANQYALPLIATCMFLVMIVALPPTLLYAMLEFGWTAYEGGLYVSLSSFARLINLAVLLPLLSKWFNSSKKSTGTQIRDDVVIAPNVGDVEVISGDQTTTSVAGTSSNDASKKHDTRSDADIRHTFIFDTWMVRIGLTVEVICFIAFGLVTTPASFTVAAAFQSLSLLASPSIRSILTILVEPSEVGELLGAMAVIESCAMIVSQLTLNTIYSASVRTMPNLIFFVCAAITGAAFVLSLFVRPAPLKETAVGKNQV